MGNNGINKGDEVSIALQAMTMENSLLQSYRTLFLGLETALFAAVFASFQVFERKGVIEIGIGGLVVGLMWMIICHAKARDVDEWMNYLTNQAVLKGCFAYMKSGFSLAGGRLARYWFNWVNPLLVMALWILVLSAK